MKVVLFNRFFYPSESATSQMASDLAFSLARCGLNIHVVCTYGREGTKRSESINGVLVHRVSPTEGNRSLGAKASAYLKFYLGARRKAAELLGPGDIAIVKTDPPMLLPLIGPTIRRSGARIVNWLQDLFPEVAQEYGIPGARLPVLRTIRNRWLDQSDWNVVISESMHLRLASQLKESTKTSVIHNWADGTQIRPIAAQSSQLRNEQNLIGKFVVGYSGNLGRVHEFETVLSAAELLKQRDDIVFLIVGSGPQLPYVRRAVEQRKLANVQFLPAQPRALLCDTLCSCDVHLTVLRPQFEGYVVPSKLYGILAAGRPCIYVGDIRSEAATILRSTDSGIAISTGDANRLADAVTSLHRDIDRRASMGRHARELFEARYDFPIAHALWLTLISSLS